MTRSGRPINDPFAGQGGRGSGSRHEQVCYVARRTGAAMKPTGKGNTVARGAAILAALFAAMPQASAADLLKLASAQRGAWESAAPELGQSAGIFAKHGITLDLLYTRDGEDEWAGASHTKDGGRGVGTLGMLRAY